MKRFLFLGVSLLAACSPTAIQNGTVPSAHNSISAHMRSSAQLRIHGELPPGSNIYNVDTLIVQSGNRSFVFPGSATYQKTASAVVVENGGNTLAFPRTATVTIERGNEWYQYPSRALPTALRALKPNESIPKARSVSSEVNKDQCSDCADGSDGKSADSVPFTTDQLAGVVDSFSGDAIDGFTATWDTSLPEYSYTYSYTLYDSSGKAVYQSAEIDGGTVIGSSGGVVIYTSAYAGSFSAIQFIVTMHSPSNIYDTGNAHAHHP